MNSINIEQMKKEWFLRFDQILSTIQNLPASQLKCLELCEARCCPRVGMRPMPPEKIASPVVVFLPFEMEYLMEKTSVSRRLFRLWPLSLTPDVTIEVGMFDLGKPCPFLDASLHCRIHTNNPLDCRTFPLLPIQDSHGHLTWEMAVNCPSRDSLSRSYATAIQQIWQWLYPYIPQEWWHLYAFADHWTGWPEKGDMEDLWALPLSPN